MGVVLLPPIARLLLTDWSNQIDIQITHRLTKPDGYPDISRLWTTYNVLWPLNLKIQQQDNSILFVSVLPFLVLFVCNYVVVTVIPLSYLLSVVGLAVGMSCLSITLLFVLCRINCHLLSDEASRDIYCGQGPSTSSTFCCQMKWATIFTVGNCKSPSLPHFLLSDEVNRYLLLGKAPPLPHLLLSDEASGDIYCGQGPTTSPLSDVRWSEQWYLLLARPPLSVGRWSERWYLLWARRPHFFDFLLSDEASSDI